jgi:hypothetical protein
MAYAYHSIHAASTFPQNSPQKKALTDSIVKYQALTEAIKHDVSIETFSPRDSSASIGGTIANLDDKAPATVRIKVDFLNKDGAIVASKEETVSAIPPSGIAKFEIQNHPGAGIVAYKYSLPK